MAGTKVHLEKLKRISFPFYRIFNQDMKTLDAIQNPFFQRMRYAKRVDQHKPKRDRILTRAVATPISSSAAGAGASFISTSPSDSLVSASAADMVGTIMILFLICCFHKGRQR